MLAINNQISPSPITYHFSYNFYEAYGPERGNLATTLREVASGYPVTRFQMIWIAPSEKDPDNEALE